MPVLAIAIALLAVECGVGYRVDPRSDLAVADNVGTHWEDGWGYRIAAHGMNHCCVIDVKILNVSADALVVVPGAATLVSRKCGVVENRWTGYVQVRDVGSFDVAEKKLEAQLLSSGHWQQVSDRVQQFAVAPHTLLNVEFVDDLRNECKPFEFQWPTRDGPVIAATFSAPR